MRNLDTLNDRIVEVIKKIESGEIEASVENIKLFDEAVVS